MRAHLIFALSLAGFLCGCQAQTDAISGGDPFPRLSGAAASAIAGDLSGRFAEQAGSLPKSVVLRSDGSDFAVALDAALRGWGYKVVAKDDKQADKSGPKPVALDYSLAAVEGQVLARLSTGAMSLSRAYAVTATGATPISPLSMMKPN